MSDDHRQAIVNAVATAAGFACVSPRLRENIEEIRELLGDLSRDLHRVMVRGQLVDRTKTEE